MWVGKGVCVCVFVESGWGARHAHMIVLPDVGFDSAAALPPNQHGGKERRASNRGAAGSTPSASQAAGLVFLQFQGLA